MVPQPTTSIEDSFPLAKTIKKASSGGGCLILVACLGLIAFVLRSIA